MIQHRLLVETQLPTIRELEDLKLKLHGHKVLEYLNDLPCYPTVVDSDDPAEFPSTFFGRITQWLNSRKPASSKASKNDNADLSGSFLSAKLKNKKDQGNKSPDQQWQSLADQAKTINAKLLAFDDLATAWQLLLTRVVVAVQHLVERPLPHSS